MSVSPKLVYCPFTCQDLPVWEIRPKKGHKVLWERINYPGLIPIGTDFVNPGDSSIKVFGIVNTPGGRMPPIYRAKDGCKAPSTWYEIDPYYNGRLPPMHLQDIDHITSNYDDEDNDGTMVSEEETNNF